MGCHAYKAASCHVREMACRKMLSPQRAVTNAEKTPHPVFWDTGKGDKGKHPLVLEKKVQWKMEMKACL